MRMAHCSGGLPVVPQPWRRGSTRLLPARWPCTRPSAVRRDTFIGSVEEFDPSSVRSGMQNGIPFRSAVIAKLPELKARHGIDFTVVNGENAAGGRGIT